jgi:hypothetical protein
LLHASHTFTLLSYVCPLKLEISPCRRGLGRIADHILKDTELAAHLPASFRTLSCQKWLRQPL